MATFSVIITAGGRSVRMGNNGPKLLKKINGKEVIVRAIEPFVSSGYSPIVVVVPVDLIDQFRPVLGSLPVELVPGGETRQESVYRGLSAVEGKGDYVLIHDGARPFVSAELIRRVAEGAIREGASVPCLPVTDTMYRVEGDRGVEPVDRASLAGVQTPQGFRFDVIIKAHRDALSTGEAVTDDGSLLLTRGYPVAVVEGEKQNTKITTPSDLPAGHPRLGLGIDIHPLVVGRPLILGGVSIPSSKGLQGHSDADVVAHAVMDALLGAVGQGDIGEHFPDSDVQYKGACSLTLLTRVRDLLCSQGAEIVNVDITLLLESPKIAPYKKEMRNNLARAMQVELGQVNVKATTSEGLGFVGQKGGAVCHAVAAVIFK